MGLYRLTSVLGTAWVPRTHPTRHNSPVRGDCALATGESPWKRTPPRPRSFSLFKPRQGRLRRVSVVPPGLLMLSLHHHTTGFRPWLERRRPSGAGVAFARGWSVLRLRMCAAVLLNRRADTRSARRGGSGDPPRKGVVYARNLKML